MRRILSILIILLVLISFSISVSQAGELVAHFLDVGHGDAIFLEFPDGATMLIDGGFPQYGSRVIEYIYNLGYTEIDVILWTHIHDDHIGGLPQVIETFDVGEIWGCPYYEETGLYKQLQSAIENKGLAQKPVSRGDVFQFGDVQVEILHPPLGEKIDRLGGPNGASVVMRLEYQNTSILFAADVDMQNDKKLAKIYGEKIKSTVLKVAHHGSDASSSKKFLRTVNPEIAVVSTGPSKYNYPSSKTIKRLKDEVPIVYRTDEVGYIIIVLDGQKAIVVEP